jgi:hypothetical protein
VEDDTAVANRLLAKLRTFVTTELDDEEAEMFASLMAPGVSLAYKEVEEPEVAGFGSESAAGSEDTDAEWRPNALAQALEAALRENGLRVVGWER